MSALLGCEVLYKMIITVTLNPSIDRTISMPKLKIGSVNRVELTSVDPGGKGVNVSRALDAFGVKTYAILVCGELGAHWFDRKLDEHHIPHAIIDAEGITRNNITIVEADGSVTKLNEPGITLTKEIISSVKESLDAIEIEGNWVVFAGKLNPGAHVDTYRELAQFARERGAKIAIDGSGPEFKSALEIKPDLIKPNQYELAELVGRSLNNIHEVIAACREVIDRGVGQVLCSLGVDGAILVTKDEVIHCEPETAASGTPVGAGDILLAIYLGGGAVPHALKNAIAWSAASVPLAGTAIPTKEQAAAVGVRENKEINDQRKLLEVH